MYFINNTTNTAQFYNLDRTRDATRDITLVSGALDWRIFQQLNRTTQKE